MYEDEQWLKYPYDLKYAVSSYGRVVKLVDERCSPKKLATPANFKDISRPAYFSKFGKYLGQIVLETFVGDKPENCRLGFRDGNRQNCMLQNLYWKDKNENTDTQSS